MTCTIDLDKNVFDQVEAITKDMRKAAKKPNIIKRAWMRIKSCF